MKEFLEKVRGAFKSAWEFLVETRKELHNVSWPTRQELTGTTVVVIVAVFFFGFFLYVVDLVVGAGINFIFRHAGQ
jgi:preprotein translocase subunit SecE